MAESDTKNAPRKEGQEMKVITKAKELAVHTFKLTINTNRYPKKLRHSLVDKLQIKSLEIYETLFEANRINVANKNERCEMITKAITYSDELNFFIELSIELSMLSDGSAGYWSRLVSDVKNMAIAWRTSERARR